MPWIGGLIAGGGSLLGGIFGANASSSAAKTQAQASDRAIQAQIGVDEVIQGQLAPYLQTGTNALGQLPGAIAGNTPELNLGYLTSLGWNIPQLNLPPGLNLPTQPNIPNPSDPATINQFQQSPGYQWQLGQGIDTIQNSAAGKTGAVSGNALKQLEGYGQGLANQDYYNWLGQANQYGIQNFNALTNATLGNYNAATNAATANYNAQGNNFWNLYNALTQGKQQGINNLSNLAGSGQNAAINAGAQGTALAGNVGQQLVGQGQALAAGQLGSAGALTGGINQAIQALLSPTGNYGGQGGSQNSTLAYLLGQGGGYNSSIAGTGGLSALDVNNAAYT